MIYRPYHLPMKKKRLLITLLLTCLVFSGIYVIGNESQPETEKYFIRITVYPTASLSRYDYNIDPDLYELRAYIDLRKGSPTGTLISEANVLVAENKAEVENDLYSIRLAVDRDKLPDSFSVRASFQGDTIFDKVFPLPNWLKIEHPRPGIIEPGRDLAVKWSFQQEAGPVNLRFYDFKAGQPSFDLNDLPEREALIPGKLILPDTIVRIFVMQSWMYKRFIIDPALVRGSEISVIPWSQVFLRSSVANNEAEK